MKHALAITFAFFSLLSLFSSRAAFAQEHEEPHVHEPEAHVELVAEIGIGVRSVNLRGMTLGTPGVSAEKRRMTVRGEDVSIFALPMMTIGGGLRVGPAIAGVEIGVGAGGGASAPAQQQGDIRVRPSGFAAAMTAATYLGVMLERKKYRLRLDGVLGTELIGLGMERPGFDDTTVSAVNQTRWTLGPRARVDLLTAGAPTIGLTLGCDARNPGNVMLGLVMAFL